MYSSSFACGSNTGGPCPGHRTSSGRSRSRPSASRYAGECARIGRDEHASLAEHRVAGQSGRAGDVGEVIGSVAGRRRPPRAGRTCSRREPHVDGPARRGQRRVRVAGADRRHRLGVVAVVVRERDAAEAAPAVEFGDQRVYVLVEIRPGIDQPRRVAADDPRVRPAQCERPRVRGANPDEIVSGNLDARHRGSMTALGGGAFSVASRAPRSPSVQAATGEVASRVSPE